MAIMLDGGDRWAQRKVKEVSARLVLDTKLDGWCGRVQGADSLHAKQVTSKEGSKENGFVEFY